MSTAHDLGSFEDEPVLAIAVAITKAGDGLSKAMKVTENPPRFRRGTRVKVLLEVEAGPVTHKPAKDGEGWVEVRTLEAVGVAFIPAALEAQAAALISSTSEAIKKAAEEARGINRLPIGDALATAHDTGDHAAGLVPGCPTCQAEADAVALEAEAELAAMGGPATAPADDFGDPEPPPATSVAGTAKAGSSSVSQLAGRRSGRAGKAAAEA